MTSLLNENHTDSETLRTKWQNTSVAMRMFEALGVKSSHRTSNVKVLRHDQASPLYMKIHQSFQSTLTSVLLSQFVPFEPNKSTGYASASKRVANRSYWKTFISDSQQGKIRRLARDQILKLTEQLGRDVDMNAYEEADIDWAV